MEILCAVYSFYGIFNIQTKSLLSCAMFAYSFIPLRQDVPDAASSPVRPRGRPRGSGVGRRRQEMLPGGSDSDDFQPQVSTPNSVIFFVI